VFALPRRGQSLQLPTRSELHPMNTMNVTDTPSHDPALAHKFHGPLRQCFMPRTQTHVLTATLAFVARYAVDKAMNHFATPGTNMQTTRPAHRLKPAQYSEFLKRTTACTHKLFFPRHPLHAGKMPSNGRCFAPARSGPAPVHRRPASRRAVKPGPRAWSGRSLRPRPLRLSAPGLPHILWHGNQHRPGLSIAKSPLPVLQKAISNPQPIQSKYA
jgi:hypothetical protein